jgi:A/G-specific adenine glycosylase
MSTDPQERLDPAHILLLDWWRNNRRDFPWRNDDVTPYQMVVAEMLLWRTRAESVFSIWGDFFAEFPTLEDLAEADEGDIEKVIAPLGLRKRAEYLKLMASRIVNDYDGDVPRDKDDLMQMLGVGEYVASAVRTFMFLEDEAVYDANVRRIMFRLFNTDDDDVARQKASDLIPSGWGPEWNYALLDLGALVCRWKPDCKVCPLCSICETGREKL